LVTLFLVTLLSRFTQV
jgi:hypothetical protein